MGKAVKSRQIFNISTNFEQKREIPRNITITLAKISWQCLRVRVSALSSSSMHTSLEMLRNWFFNEFC
jgi:hypothetical protein